MLLLVLGRFARLNMPTKPLGNALCGRKGGHMYIGGGIVAVIIIILILILLF